MSVHLSIHRNIYIRKYIQIDMTLIRSTYHFTLFSITNIKHGLITEKSAKRVGLEFLQ